jgi:glycine oxidase
VTSTVWEDLLTEEERRSLAPGAPHRLDPTPDVVVVGGGAIGLAAAVFCRRAGLERVLLIDRDRLASGPTGRAAGTLTPGIHALLRSAAFVRLASRGLELHRELDREWGDQTGFRTIDSLVALPPVVPPPEVLERTGASLVDGVAAREIEPEFGEVEHALHIPRQGAILPLRFIAALASRAGTVATGVELLDIERSGERAVRVRTSRGDVSPGAIVLATGVVDRLPVPQHRVKGHMLATEPAPFRLRTLPAGIVGLVQTSDGRIVAGGTFDPGDDDPAIRPEVIDALVAELQRLVPGSRELAVTHRWTCFRPATTDELPVIDLVPGLTNVWASAGHYRTGILVAPAAAEIVAGWISTGRAPAMARDFAAARFPDSASVAGPTPPESPGGPIGADASKGHRGT